MLTITGDPIATLELPVNTGWESLVHLKPSRLMYSFTEANLDADGQCNYMDTVWIWEID
jgi:hypothetical protein